MVRLRRNGMLIMAGTAVQKDSGPVQIRHPGQPQRRQACISPPANRQALAAAVCLSPLQHPRQETTPALLMANRACMRKIGNGSQLEHLRTAKMVGSRVSKW